MTVQSKNKNYIDKRKRSAPENEVKVKVDINYHFKKILESCIFLHSQQKNTDLYCIALRGSTKLVYSCLTKNTRYLYFSTIAKQPI